MDIKAIAKGEYSELIRKISAYVDKLEDELEKPQKENEMLRSQLSGATSRNLAWSEMLLEAHQIKKSNDLYRRLFDMIPHQDRVKGELQGYAIRQFKDQFPQTSWSKLQSMKANGRFSQSQIEIFEAINAFKETCSRNKWQE